MKYGIQVLPLTPASKYLSSIGNTENILNGYVKDGGKISDEWGDLNLVFQSFFNKSAIDKISQVRKNEDNDPQSLFLQSIYQNHN